MLRNSAYRNMHQGEEPKLRNGSLARERRHLALHINSQEKVKRCNRCHSHSGGQAVRKVERGCFCRSEDEYNGPRHLDQQQCLEIKAVVIQRAWRAIMSRKVSLEEKDENSGIHHWDEALASESLHEPLMTTNISTDQLKSLQSGSQHANEDALQLQSSCLTMDLDNININLPPVETKVLIIQRAWRDFLQRQEVEKRSPSPPSLSSSDKMSMSISMMTLSDGSSPVSNTCAKTKILPIRHEEDMRTCGAGDSDCGGGVCEMFV
ncbi:hypothetical protein OJAV_G00130720 [Oryzias javanicus]|uniref:Fusion protein IQCJ-SCHIP1 N-terminal domain-containing protein n=1 Tax=Oryzias javanicus TaxID=123683 RepID=A0A437CQ51_ORYJA|nr:hypothetical protein OJAV_G00130720 [Oryzias javanicus]